MSKELPNALKKTLEKNKALIRKVLGDAFYNRIAIGDVTHIDLQKIENVIRAAALKTK
jgi:hypothetical protein